MYNYNRTKRGFSRWLTALAIIFFVLFVSVGAILGSNYKHIGNLVKVVSLIRTQYIEPVQTTSLVDGAMRGMVESLEDPYSIYLDPETFTQFLDQIRGASFGGLGVLVGVNKEELLTVVRVYKGTPAAEEGVQDGDFIVGIDGKDVRGIDLETAIGLMRGPVGSKIELSLVREGYDEPIKKELVREEISVPTAEGKILPDTRIGYVAISQFNEKTPDEMVEVLNDLRQKGMRGIILDLRNNPGGEVTSATRVADNFIPEGPIVYIDYRTGQEEVKKADKNYLNIPLAVLVNENSASAAEILAGAVKDTGVGELVGVQTFGKGIVQTLFPLDNGAGLKLTTARYLTPNKHDIHKKGVKPDVIVKNLPDIPGDEQLDKAVELLSKELS